jgi:glycosyltransferase involved in cell wall biosynthesis
VYGRIRTAHLERFRNLEPAEVWFSATRYDFDPALVDGDDAPRRVSRLGAVRELWRRSFRVIELTEPAIVTRWPDMLLQVLAARLRSWRTGDEQTLVTYCIAIADPADELAARSRLPRPIARWVTRRVLNLLVRSLDRVAFGTAGSFDMYAGYVDPHRLARVAEMFEALPAPCDCIDPNGPRDERRLLFVGAFDDRKGIRQLMAAWDVVRTRSPDLTLCLIGTGRLVDVVTDWASSRPEASVLVDPPRDAIHAELRRSAVVALLSQRTAFWREQIGLPILEGLSHGCTVVATTETGLAAWLSEHGHEVIDPRASAEEHADAIVRAFAAARRPSDVLADLPATDRRIDADRWMVTGNR